MSRYRRPIVNKRRDRAVFRSTAVRTNVKNIPGRKNAQGGIVL